MLYQASNFIWIIFSNVCPTPEDKLYNVPYDCTFLIVCPKNLTTFQLLEAFQVKNMTWINECGIWKISSGLTIPNKLFYHRRMNLNGTELVLKSAYTDNVRSKFL